MELHSWAGSIRPGTPGTPPVSSPPRKTKAIALVGDARAGLLELTSVEDPANHDGEDVEWASFTLNQGVPTEGKPANTVTYAGPGGWVAYKAVLGEEVGAEGWVVRWKLRKFSPLIWYRGVLV